MNASDPSSSSSAFLADWQREFLSFALERGVLRFGDFTLKSGRRSPYFFNTGLFNTGQALQRLGRAYATALNRADPPCDMLFGPAYKGIPLVSAVSIASADLFGRDLPWAFDRKEVKDHGEGGQLVGAPLSGRVVVVDDVVSSGMSIRAAAGWIRQAGAELTACLIALDRQERGEGSRSATQELAEALGAPVISVINLDAIESWLADPTRPAESSRLIPEGSLEAIRSYREQYGAGG